MVRLLARDGRLPAAAQTTRGVRLFRRSEVEELASHRAGMVRHHHTVQFYEKKEFLSGFVAKFIAVALRARAPVVVIARESHRQAFCEHDGELGVDMQAARDSGQLALYDADEVLATFMVGGMPDPELFRSRIGEIIRKSVAARPRVRLRIYGEMVDLLWRDGHRDAALRLEQMWNELARDHSFALLCAYDMGNFRRADHEAQFAAICDAHTRVTPAESFSPAAADDEHQRQIALLQHRARALANELDERKQTDATTRALHDFLAALGQELRAPLSGIQTTLDLLRGRGSSAEEKDLAGQVGSLARLVDELVDFSRVSRGEVAIQPRRLDLADLVERAAHATASLLEQRGHRLDIHVPAGIAVDVDPDRMAEVVSHLLASAARRSDRGAPIQLRATRGAGSVSLSVVDEGPGLEPDRIDCMFDPLVPRPGSIASPTGDLGLGLAVARHLVQLHGGTVAARPCGRGNELLLTISAAAPAILAIAAGDGSGAGPAPRAPRGPGPVESRRILVVDDNEDLASLLAELLQELGHEVQVAYSGATALERAAAFEPDVALLDIGMPDMDGYQLARELRDLRGGPIRLIAVTGYAQDTDRRRSEEAGFSGHLVKPVDPARLARLIQGQETGSEK